MKKEREQNNLPTAKLSFSRRKQQSLFKTNLFYGNFALLLKSVSADLFSPLQGRKNLTLNLYYIFSFL